MKFHVSQQVICITKISGLYFTTIRGVDIGECGVDINNPKVKEVVTIKEIEPDGRLILVEYERGSDGALQTFRAEYFKSLEDFISEAIEKKMQQIEI